MVLGVTNPLQPDFLWMLRQNEKDVINLYNFLTPFIQLVTGSNILNFGYWTEKTKDPLQAQQELCTIVGEFANLDSARNVLDIGSGFSAPAIHWKKIYDIENIICVNINSQQLTFAAKIIPNSIVNYNRANDLTPSSLVGNNNTTTIAATNDNNNNNKGVISLVNATATTLPFADHCVDRIIALESAQHFKTLIEFVRESKRILKDNGLLVIAIPVTKITTAGAMRNTTTTTTTTVPSTRTSATIKSLIQLRKLGILLSLTWVSEHYELSNIKSIITKEGFEIEDIQHIGSYVYEPLASYYIQNRKMLKNVIMKQYSSSFIKNILYDTTENIIYKSALKMKEASKKGTNRLCSYKGSIIKYLPISYYPIISLF